jgi:hypothetical protein
MILDFVMIQLIVHLVYRWVVRRSAVNSHDFGRRGNWGIWIYIMSLLVN